MQLNLSFIICKPFKVEDESNSVGVLMSQKLRKIMVDKVVTVKASARYFTILKKREDKRRARLSESC